MSAGTMTTPPWHSYCGCFGCRMGNRIGEKCTTGSSRESSRSAAVSTSQPQSESGSDAARAALEMRDESKYGICDLCGEPQKWLHDIGTEIRCGEVTTTGKYVDPDLVAVYLSREDAEDWARSRWMSGSVGERSVAAARAALEANPRGEA